MTDTILEILQEMDFTRDLEPDQQKKLASMAFQVSFPEETLIFREADEGELLYMIREGQVAIEIHVPGQGRSTILTLGPSQVLGWSSLIPTTRKTATARTVSPVQALAIDAKELRDTMQADHDLGFALLQQLVEVITGRLTATRLQLLDIFAHEAPDT
ncbi:MAG: cyclic nucleotide-binding domain-containing protein [Chloroflexota bacterium]|nr:cyclic nucleotide-binding domain-containing protein [Chloroflexota bacterium]